MALDIGDDLLAQNSQSSIDPDQAGAQIHPEMSDDVLNERKGLWRGFLDRLRTDPNFRTSVMATGAAMMRSPGFGQNVGDVIGNAMMTGINTLSSLRQQQFMNQRMTQQDQLAADKTKADITNSTQQTANDTTRAATSAKVGEAQVGSLDAQSAITKIRAELEKELEPRKVAADEKRADAAMVAAKAETTRAQKTNLNPSGQMQMAEARAQALMEQNPNLSHAQAVLQAQNELMKDTNSPSSIATRLFDTSVKNWQSDFNNIGKPLPPELLQKWKEDAIRDATNFKSLDQKTQPMVSVPDQVPTTDGGTGDSLVGRHLKDGDVVAEIISDDGKIVKAKLPNGTVKIIPAQKAIMYLMAE